MPTSEILTDFYKLVTPLLTDVEKASTAQLTRDRVLLPLIAMTVQGMPELIEQQVRAALDASIPPETVLEVLYQLTPVIGLPKVTAALTRVEIVFEQQSITPAVAETTQPTDFGAQVQTELYGNEIGQLLQDLPAGAGQFIPKMLTEHFFNDFYGRNTLNVKDRERFELIALITLNVDFQINAHAKGSLKAGNTEAELVWSTIQLLPYIGFPFVINSVRQIHQAAIDLKTVR